MSEDASEPRAEDDDLEAHVRRRDPDRWLSSRFAHDAQARRDLAVLYAFDRELARIPHAVSETLVGEIRFAWWREALEEIDAGAPPRAHPVVVALAETARRRGLKLAELEPLIDLHARALYPEPFANEAEVRDWLAGAASLAGAAARVLDPAADPALAATAAQAWTLARTPLEGRIDFDAARLDALHADLLKTARADVRRLPHTAFPAIAHAALARRRNDHPGGLQARLRLVLAMATGRL